MFSDDTFDKNLDRARQLLESGYADAPEVMTRLVKDGMTPADAFLIIKAAQVVPSPPPAVCETCGRDDGRHKMDCYFQ